MRQIDRKGRAAQEQRAFGVDKSGEFQVKAFLTVLRGGLALSACLAASVLMAEPLRPLARPESIAPAALSTQQDAADRTAAAEPATEELAEEERATDASAAEVAAAEPRSALPPRDPNIGPETNLPLPRFVALKSGDGNVRRGPSLSHRIDWVFRRADMPLQITAEYGHWRRVIDREGLGGWVHYSLLSGNRTVIVDQDMLPLYARPDPASQQNALLELGVIARLGECNPDWCRISVAGYRGWAPKSALWGVGAAEIRD